MENQGIRENKMGVMPVGKLVLTMSLPIVISMLVQALYNVVDSMFVSMISKEAFNAVALAFPAQNLMIGFATGSAVGVNALVSRALGAKDPKHANRVALNGVCIALCCYVLFLLFAIFGARAFITLQSASSDIAESRDAVIQYGCDYLLVVCGMSFGIFGEIMFERLLTSTGRTVCTMISQGVGAIINLIFDPIFIFVFHMGVTGAALATVLGQIVACCIAFILNLKKNTDIRLRVAGFRPDVQIIRGICAIGVPSIIMVAVGSVMTVLFNIILSKFTSEGLYMQNVFGSYFKLNSFIFMPIFGLNNGVIPIVAYNYGAQKRDRMMQAIRVAVAAAVTVMTLGMIIFEAFPGQLLRIFILNFTPEEVEMMLTIGRPALRIIGTTFVFAAICIALGAVFQALGKGVYSMVVSISRQLVILLPAAYVLARIGQNIGNDNLVWISFPIAEIASLAVSLICFKRLYDTVISKVGRDTKAAA